MIKLHDLVNFLNNYLKVHGFKSIDIVLNGLQIEGDENVRKVITCVSPSIKVIEKAIQENANVIISHHGIFMKNQSITLTGSLKRKIELFIKYGISLLTYHLPLDAHPEIGNNISIAKILKVNKVYWISEDENISIALIGEFENPKSITEVYDVVKQKINENSILLKYGRDEVKKVLIVSGAGARYIKRFRKGEIDLFITGEFREDCEVYAMDEEINVIIAGHYATEKFGVINLAKVVQEEFKVEAKFVDIGQIV